MTARDVAGNLEGRLVSALDLVSDAFLALDAQGTVEHVNGAAEHALGIDRRDAVGRHASELFEQPSEGNGSAHSLFAGARVDGSGEGLVKPRNADGTLRYELSASAGGALLRLRPTWSDGVDVVNTLLRPVIHDSRGRGPSDTFDRDDRFLSELDRELDYGDDAVDVFATVAKRVAMHLNAERCVFSEILSGRELIVIHPGYEADLPSVTGTFPIDAFGAETRDWLDAGRIVITTDTMTDPRTRSFYDTAYGPVGARATVMVPLMQAGSCVGCVTLGSSTPRDWTGRELALLHAVATKTLHVIETGRTVRNQEAQVERLLNLNSDLERRVQARTAELTVALKEREALLAQRDQAANQLRDMIEASPTGMLMVSLDGRIAMVNAKTEAIFGYERGELVGRPLDALLTAGSRVAATSRSAAPPASLLPSSSDDVEGQRKDGSRLPVHLEVNPLETAEGRFMLASVSDITDRVEVERTLRENEARYRRLFHDSPTALCEQDFSEVKAYLDDLSAGGVGDLCAYLRSHPEVVASAARRVRFTEVNDATLEMYEAESRSEILGNWHKLFDQEMLKVFVEELCFLVQGKGSLFAARSSTRTLKGRRNEIAFRLSVLPGSERTWSRLVASIFDMTAYHEAERKLRAALREKDVLLKEVHHRVKNNLQVISSLLNLQAQYVEDPATRAVFASSQGRVQSIALVHEKLYQSRDLSHIKLGEYLKTLLTDLLSAHSATDRGISSVIDVADLSLSVDVAIPCGLIVNELVSNALKHAFAARRSGTVTVRAQRTSGELIELSVADDGRGLPQAANPQNSSSLGLDLVFTFAEQLGAEVEILREGGTRFVFRFREEAA